MITYCRAMALHMYFTYGVYSEEHVCERLKVNCVAVHSVIAPLKERSDITHKFFYH